MEHDANGSDAVLDRCRGASFKIFFVPSFFLFSPDQAGDGGDQEGRGTGEGGTGGNGGTGGRGNGVGKACRLAFRFMDQRAPRCIPVVPVFTALAVVRIYDLSEFTGSNVAIPPGHFSIFRFFDFSCRGLIRLPFLFSW